MHYLPRDVDQMLSGIHYLALARASSASHFLERLVDQGERYREFLQRYAEVRIEPLDYYYVSLRCLGALTVELIEDLCANYTWRGVVAASWLVCLSPRREFRPPLQDARFRAPRNQWIVDLALAETEGAEVPGFERIHRYVRMIRVLMKGLPRPATMLRRAPDKASQNVLKLQTERIRREYKRGGVSAARSAIEA